MDNHVIPQVAPQSVPEAGLLEKVKETLSPEKLTEKFGLNRSKLFDMGVYLVVGFLAGFLLKKYGKYFFILALFIVFLIGLQQYNVLTITINWDRAYELFGIQTTQLAGVNIFTIYWEWIKLNFAVVLSFSVGFLIGLKVG